MSGLVNSARAGLACVLLCILLTPVTAAESVMPDPAAQAEQQAEQDIERLQQPLYTPFVERYVLDELKQLRTDMAAQRVELISQIANREVAAADRAVSYTSDAVTYFFYLIAGVSSVLVLVGWSSVRDIKERFHTLADEEISRLVNEYEGRLRTIEFQLSEKSRDIQDNREEIEITREIHALWLRAAQESSPANKIAVYDQILKLAKHDTEALTYKADAVLELGEPQWAINLCQQALVIDPDNSHAFYQLACAYTALESYDEAVNKLQQVMQSPENYRDEILKDEALKPLHAFRPFRDLMNLDSV